MMRLLDMKKVSSINRIIIVQTLESSSYRLLKLDKVD